MPDTITLNIGNQTFSGWTEITVSRALDRMASHFRIAVTSPTGTPPFGAAAISPFSPCVIKIGKDTVLTGFIDDVEPDFDAARHMITVSGRSATCDLIDCTPEISGGQYRGYTLEQIARAIAKLFGRGVVVQTEASQVFPDVTLQRGETAFTFLERLARLAGVLLTDDELGNLVLATSGGNHATGTLVQGQNVLRARAKLSGAHRFSTYAVNGQRALGSTTINWLGAGGVGNPSAAAPAPVQTALKATATDSEVPRYRPRVSMAEAQLDQAGMQRRATWERNFAIGRAVEAEITVKGWRQGGPADTSGKTLLWQTNNLVSTTIPFLGIDQDLLIAAVEFSDGAREGQITRLKLGPLEGYTPDPGQVKLKARKGKQGATASNWNGAGGH